MGDWRNLLGNLGELFVNLVLCLMPVMANVRCSKSDGRCLMSDVPCPLFDVRCLMSDVRHLLSPFHIWKRIILYRYQSINYWFNLFLLGFFLFLTPVYIIGEQPKLTGQNIGSAVFCYIIANQFLVFTFGIVSLYTVTLLAVERWFAVFRPLRYKTTFRPHRVQKYLVIIWLSSFASNSTHLLETKFLLHSKNHRRPRRSMSLNEYINIHVDKLMRWVVETPMD